MENFDKKLFDDVSWDKPGKDIESESFRIIESELPKGDNETKWRVARRLVHTTGDFGVAKDLYMHGDPRAELLKALKSGAMIYSDSNMIKSGISVPKLKQINGNYERDSIHCYVADDDVRRVANEKGITRALASIEKAKRKLNGAVVLIGNAPLALAGIVKLYVEENIRPALIIGMPVGFVNVVEAKRLLEATDIPSVVLRGRRGGSPLAVATLHALLEESLV
jgi:precorrin isomerase